MWLCTLKFIHSGGIYNGQSAVPLESIGNEQSESERSLKLKTVHSKYFPPALAYHKHTGCTSVSVSVRVSVYKLNPLHVVWC